MQTHPAALKVSRQSEGRATDTDFGRLLLAWRVSMQFVEKWMALLRSFLSVVDAGM